jgi:hypothetical protein
MKKIAFIIFLSLGFKGYSQSSDIVYIIPDNVEVALERQITYLKVDTTKTLVYFLLEKDDEGIYSLSLFHDIINQQEGLTGKILKLTNRVLLINKNKYPLILDYDFTFGTPKVDQIATFGSREGNIVRSVILFHGYTIYFNKLGKIIKTSNY